MTSTRFFTFHLHFHPKWVETAVTKPFIILFAGEWPLAGYEAEEARWTTMIEFYSASEVTAIFNNQNYSKIFGGAKTLSILLLED